MTTFSTNSINLVYCFSKALASTEEQYTISLKLFNESVSLSSKFYKVKIFTDNLTANDLVNFNAEVVDLGKVDLLFVDDFKILVLDFLKPNDLLVDIDVLIYDRLNIDLTKDIIFDFIDRPNRKWYTDYFRILKVTSIKSDIHEIGIPEIVPNIGFLKIHNSDLLFKYKYYYNLFRNKVISYDNLNGHFRGFSIILGQYLLGAVLKQGNFSYFNISSQNTPAVYKHLSGPIKFRKQQLI